MSLIDDCPQLSPASHKPILPRSCKAAKYPEETANLEKFVESTLARITRGHDLIGRLEELEQKPRVQKTPSCNNVQSARCRNTVHVVYVTVVVCACYYRCLRRVTFGCVPLSARHGENHAGMYVCMHVCMYVCTCEHMHAYTHLCMHACMHVCMHECKYVCTHV